MKQIKHEKVSNNNMNKTISYKNNLLRQLTKKIMLIVYGKLIFPNKNFLEVLRNFVA